jgi:hypothetical protein
LAEVVRPRVSVENEAVCKEIKGVVQQVDAVGDGAERAEKAPAPEGGEPSAGLRDGCELEGSVKESERGVADGDGDHVDRVHRPPEEATYTEEKYEQGVRAEEFAEAGVAPGYGDKHGTGNRVCATRAIR